MGLGIVMTVLGTHNAHNFRMEGSIGKLVESVI